jgi:hypothetical protein
MHNNNWYPQNRIVSSQPPQRLLVRKNHVPPMFGCIAPPPLLTDCFPIDLDHDDAGHPPPHHDDGIAVPKSHVDSGWEVSVSESWPPFFDPTVQSHTQRKNPSTATTTYHHPWSDRWYDHHRTRSTEKLPSPWSQHQYEDWNITSRSVFHTTTTGTTTTTTTSTRTTLHGASTSDQNSTTQIPSTVFQWLPSSTDDDDDMTITPVVVVPVVPTTTPVPTWERKWRHPHRLQQQNDRNGSTGPPSVVTTTTTSTTITATELDATISILPSTREQVQWKVLVPGNSSMRTPNPFLPTTTRIASIADCHDDCDADASQDNSHDDDIHNDNDDSSNVQQLWKRLQQKEPWTEQDFMTKTNRTLFHSLIYAQTMGVSLAMLQPECQTTTSCCEP